MLTSSNAFTPGKDLDIPRASSRTSDAEFIVGACGIDKCQCAGPSIKLHIQRNQLERLQIGPLIRYFRATHELNLPADLGALHKARKHLRFDNAVELGREFVELLRVG